MNMLDGRVAIVIGAGNGIGLATARQLSEQGALVLVNDVDTDAANSAGQALPGDVVVHVGDLTLPGIPEGIVGHALSAWGQIDIVVNNAGDALEKPNHLPADEWFQRILELHQVAPFRLLRAAAPHMIEQAKRDRADGIERFRKVVNISSTMGHLGSASQATYSSGQSGMIGLTSALAEKWARLRINVNALAPSLKSDRNGSGWLADAAGAALFLCSPWSNLLNGHVLTISDSAIDRPAT